MNIHLALPTRPGAAGDVARRLARWMGPALGARDGSNAAARLLALGATIATTRTYTARSLLECFPHTAVDTIGQWERSLGMLSGEGDSLASRQRSATARWRAIHAGPSLAEVTTTARSYVTDATVLELAMEDVYATVPAATQRLVVLLPADSGAWEDAALRARLAGSLAVELPGHVTWAIARGDGPDIDPFLTDDPGPDGSACDLDVLDR